MADDRLGKLEAKIEARTIQRETELAEIRTDLATLAEVISAAKTVNGKLEDRLLRLEQVRQPGVLTYIAPALAVAGLLAAAFTFVLTLKEEVQNEKHVSRDQEIAALHTRDEEQAIRTAYWGVKVDEVWTKMYRERAEISDAEARLKMLETQVYNIDKYGVRGATDK